jgi:hypothetical protein
MSPLVSTERRKLVHDLVKTLDFGLFLKVRHRHVLEGLDDGEENRTPEMQFYETTALSMQNRDSRSAGPPKPNVSR